MPPLIKDDGHPGLFRNSETGIYYFRKYITGLGEIKKSTGLTDRKAAIHFIKRNFSAWFQEPREKAEATIDFVIGELYSVKQQKAQKTFESFEGHCRLHILPFYAGRKISEVAPLWPKYVTAQSVLNSKRQLGHDRRYVTEILSHAVNAGYLTHFPRLTLDPAKRMKKPVALYGRDDISRILNCQPEDFEGTEFTFTARALQKIKLQVRLALYCGMRPPGEIRHLRKSWIDWVAGTIWLDPEIVKTRTDRTYPVDAELLRELREWCTLTDSDCVFPKRGEPDVPETGSDKKWQQLKRALGIKGTRYHLRHAHGAIAVRTVSPSIVKKNMGTSLPILDRVYMKPDAEEHKRQASAVKNYYEGRG